MKNHCKTTQCLNCGQYFNKTIKFQCGHSFCIDCLAFLQLQLQQNDEFRHYEYAFRMPCMSCCQLCSLDDDIFRNIKKRCNQIQSKDQSSISEEKSIEISIKHMDEEKYKNLSYPKLIQSQDQFSNFSRDHKKDDDSIYQLPSQSANFHEIDHISKITDKSVDIINDKKIFKIQSANTQQFKQILQNAKKCKDNYEKDQLKSIDMTCNQKFYMKEKKQQQEIFSFHQKSSNRNNNQKSNQKQQKNQLRENQKENLKEIQMINQIDNKIYNLFNDNQIKNDKKQNLQNSFNNQFKKSLIENNSQQKNQNVIQNKSQVKYNKKVLQEKSIEQVQEKRIKKPSCHQRQQQNYSIQKNLNDIVHEQQFVSPVMIEILKLKNDLQKKGLKQLIQSSHYQKINRNNAFQNFKYDINVRFEQLIQVIRQKQNQINFEAELFNQQIISNINQQKEIYQQQYELIQFLDNFDQKSSEIEHFIIQNQQHIKQILNQNAQINQDSKKNDYKKINQKLNKIRKQLDNISFDNIQDQVQNSFSDYQSDYLDKNTTIRQFYSPQAKIMDFLQTGLNKSLSNKDFNKRNLAQLSKQINDHIFKRKLFTKSPCHYKSPSKSLYEKQPQNSQPRKYVFSQYQKQI